MSVCKKCGFEYNWSFCPMCGVKIAAKRTCKKCGESFLWDYCPKCGTRSSDEEEPFLDDLSDVTLSSQDETAGNDDGSEGLDYKLNDGEYVVTGMGRCIDRDVVIPAKHNYRPVVSIGNGAFSDCESLKSVIIPDSVTSIGKEAFSGCLSLTSVVIPDSVTSIGEWAFLNCLSLTSVTVPKGMKHIDKEAFLGCKKLVEVCNLSSLLILLGREENGCVAKYAKNVYSRGKSKISTTYDGYVFYNDGESHCLVGYIGTETGLTLPDDTGFSYEVYRYAFCGCSSLTSVTLPNSVTAIGEYAFKDCSSLKTATIPDSVKSIGEGAFSGCSSLESMVLPFVGGHAKTMTASAESHLGYIFGEKRYDNGVRTAQRYFQDSTVVFYIPSSLKSVVITGGEIPYGAFSNCSSIETVSIVGAVTLIDESAFLGCTSLTTITIPDSVTWIGGTAFSGCTSLGEVYYYGTRSQWRGVLKNSFGKMSLKKSLREATINFNCKK